MPPVLLTHVVALFATSNPFLKLSVVVVPSVSPSGAPCTRWARISGPGSKGYGRRNYVGERMLSGRVRTCDTTAAALQPTAMVTLGSFSRADRSRHVGRRNARSEDIGKHHVRRRDGSGARALPNRSSLVLVRLTRASQELHVAPTRNAGKNIILPLRLVRVSNKLKVAPTRNAGEDLLRGPILLSLIGWLSALALTAAIFRLACSSSGQLPSMAVAIRLPKRPVLLFAPLVVPTAHAFPMVRAITTLTKKPAHPAAWIVEQLSEWSNSSAALLSLIAIFVALAVLAAAVRRTSASVMGVPLGTTSSTTGISGSTGTWATSTPRHAVPLGACVSASSVSVSAPPLAASRRKYCGQSGTKARKLTVAVRRSSRTCTSSLSRRSSAPSAPVAIHTRVSAGRRSAPSASRRSLAWVSDHARTPQPPQGSWSQLPRSTAEACQVEPPAAVCPAAPSPGEGEDRRRRKVSGSICPSARRAVMRRLSTHPMARCTASLEALWCGA